MHILFKLTVAASFLGAALIGPSNAAAQAVVINPELAHPVVMANKFHTTYLKVGLRGGQFTKTRKRAPVNVAIVLDKSGSMSGRKITEARQAAKLAVGSLNPQDIVSLVTYDTTVRVVVPATKVSEPSSIYRAIDNIRAGGSTALFAGVSKGANELRKFYDEQRVNRIILLSDGLANVGPSSPGELASLGQSLGREGISVTTIGLGLGYNEDLMSRLAMASDGNHAFVEHASQLAGIFRSEFGDVLSVVAQRVDIEIDCGEGVRPVRVLGRDAEVLGQKVRSSLNQLYANQEKYVLVELSLPALESRRRVAKVKVRYSDMATKEIETMSQEVFVRTTQTAGAMESATNKDVMIAVVEMLANEQNKLALNLRDSGDVDKARKVLKRNVDYLRDNASKYKSERLKNLEKRNEDNADNLARDEDWRRTRKTMRKFQHELDMQQSY